MKKLMIIDINPSSLTEENIKRDTKLLFGTICDQAGDDLLSDCCETKIEFVMTENMFISRCRKCDSICEYHTKDMAKRFYSNGHLK